jgi:tryptophan halogenase
VTEDRRIRKIVIVGGGTAGWIAASILARTAPEHQCSITVVESSEIGTIGVGEATIPPIIDLIRMLGINEADFIRHTESTFKLGIQFKDWCVVGESYWHPFGTFGATISRRPFHHFFLKARLAGDGPRIADYSICAALANEGKFQLPDPKTLRPTGLRYAVHFDAALVANYLRVYSMRLGAERMDRRVTGANLRPDGFIESLVCADGSRIDGDLFIDCSGFRGVLIEECLRTGYIDWHDVLPCDRAVALQTRSSTAPQPFTVARARAAGWHWRIPLQHRVGNGYVYSSAHASDQQAIDDLTCTVGEAGLTEPRTLRFTTGRRRLFWNRNCIALGLSAGFLEPLESTSIQLVINAVFNLLDHFPDRDFDGRNRDSYNAALIEEFENVRDFIVLHYCRTQRSDTPFWQSCRELKIPDSLLERIEMYQATGRIRSQRRDLFTDLSWFFVLDGMRVAPQAIDPLVDGPLFAQVKDLLSGMRSEVARDLRQAPMHDSYFRSGSPFAANEER